MNKALNSLQRRLAALLAHMSLQAKLWPPPESGAGLVHAITEPSSAAGQAASLARSPGARRLAQKQDARRLRKADRELNMDGCGSSIHRQPGRGRP